MIDSNPTPEPLERRPEARAFKIEDLLAEVKLGRVRIPSFQRGLKWEREDASKLLDSLYRGYPVGTLLFWETEAEAREMQFGSIKISAGGRNDALWVVDGQQRIVSLARVLLSIEPDTDGFALYYDLDAPKFIAPPPPSKRSEDPTRWLPMTEVLDSERLLQWLFEKMPASKERRDRAIQLGKRIREYEIPAYIVRTNNQEILREVFSRTNDSGKRLKASEVFDALHGARSQNRPATIPEIVSDLEALGFGRVEEKLLYRLLRVLHGVDATVRIGDGALRLSEKDAESAYRKTAEAARLVIQFFKQDAGIPLYDLLPYKHPFITLGKFFHYHPTPQPRSRELLVRWLWRGALNGTHQGNTLSTQQALERIDAESEEKSIQRLLKATKERPGNMPDVSIPFKFNHAVSKLQALALIDLGPCNLETGALLQPNTLFGLESQELPLPQIITYMAGDHDQLTRSAANRLIHPAKNRGVRRLLMNVADQEVLTSHGITEPTLQALREGDATRFLALRADYLRPHFQQFFDRHARWDEPDRPSLSALVISDEEEED
ncbi:Protein of unknown function DUF262 [Methylomagnum ishizawai]|uniref:GmrSD restriction endonucleases N-terminal domain-containing protein n=1 Tax=Methylomagnum ishizawai TaxID=1760988 RepID=A0A1Y6D8D5_9GAMM|nr:DUF262 domain-containing protein [Methylomagnum ishizawai]SMF97023.1 Protein of unknown function DUF262 [Methylomagnum ishizawai]